VEYLANVIYAEAGGESIQAKHAVATVIWERSQRDPSNIHSVITTPRHFASPKKEEVDEWNDCMGLAKKMYSGEFAPVTVDLPNETQVYPDHFYHGKAPYWAKGKPYSKIGKLKFLRLAEDEEED
jgi:hypothetical protein